MLQREGPTLRSCPRRPKPLLRRINKQFINGRPATDLVEAGFDGQLASSNQKGQPLGSRRLDPLLRRVSSLSTAGRPGICQFIKASSNRKGQPLKSNSRRLGPLLRRVTAGRPQS